MSIPRVHQLVYMLEHQPPDPVQLPGRELTGYLTQNPIAATDIGEHDGGAQLALGEVGKRERNEYYRAD
jgi:hypothetical protein